MRRPALLILLLFFWALPASRALADPPACRLPAGLWQKRQAAQKQFDASGGSSSAAWEALEGMDAAYRGFVLSVAEAYEKRETAEAGACCDGAAGDPEAGIFCALVRYRFDGRKHPARLLGALPATPETAAALDNLLQAATQDASAPALAASPVENVTEELFRLMLAGDTLATERYFYLLHHSGGAWADDAADQLEHYLTDHPAELIRNWPTLRSYWNLSEGITWDVDAGWWDGLVERYRHLCPASQASCSGILDRLEKAARAAGGGKR